MTDFDSSLHLVSGFMASSARFPDRPALEVAGEVLSYSALRTQAFRIASALRRVPAADVPLTAILAERSTTAYAGVLGSLLSGHGYVPLGIHLPVQRTVTCLNVSGSRSLVVDVGGEAQLEAVLEGAARELTVLLPHRADAGELRARWSRHRFVGGDEMDDSGKLSAPTLGPDALAYLMFTSGSTGQPKGVAIAQRSACRMVDVFLERLSLSEDDRFSQFYDLTFDASVSDLFVAWKVGGCVCVPSRRELLAPLKYIHRSKLTVWDSAPSLALIMKRLGALESTEFLTLRYTLFGGEALTTEVVSAWTRCAPQSIVVNVYGPT
jgi:non-ribosomal peptide synthetase component F